MNLFVEWLHFKWRLKGCQFISYKDNVALCEEGFLSQYGKVNTTEATGLEEVTFYLFK